jgi:hypothetical protein
MSQPLHIARNRVVNIDALKANAAQIVTDLGFGFVSPNWSGCDPVWPAFEKMAEEGAIVIVKIDGGRKSQGDNGRFTIVVSSGLLGDDFFRTDTHVLEVGLARAILYYAKKCWQ